MDRLTLPGSAGPWLLGALLIAACSSGTAPSTPLGSLPAAVYVVNTSFVGIGILGFSAGANGDATPAVALFGSNTAMGSSGAIARDGAGNLYVTNSPPFGTHGGSVTVYAPSANGNASPIRTIAGDSTGLFSPAGVTTDSAGTLYVADSASITVYAPNANGNARPIRTIVGSNIGPGLRMTWLALDRAGNLYVTIGAEIAVFAAGASGNATPIRTIAGSNTGLTRYGSIALDTAANLYFSKGYGSSGVTVYAAGANGNVSPIRTIATGPCTGGVALDSAGNLYVTNWGCSPGSINVFAPEANGNVPPLRTIAGPLTALDGAFGIALDAAGHVYVVARTRGFSVARYNAGAAGDAAPASVIAGPQTGLAGPSAIALDASGYLYVANAVSNSITVYRLQASGDVTPSRTIAGSNAGLNSPDGLALDWAGNLYAANAANSPTSGGSVTVYAGGASGNTTPLRTITGDPGFCPGALGFDGNGILYVANPCDGSIVVYAYGANGKAMPLRTIAPASRPADGTGGSAILGGLAVDGTGDVYIAYGNANKVVVFAPGASGQATPERTIEGSHTGLESPVCLAVGATGALYALNPTSLTVYAAWATGDATPLATLVGPHTGLTRPACLAVE